MANPKGRLQTLIQRTAVSFLVGAATLGLEVTFSVAVADPWKDESGHGKHGHWDYRGEPQYEHKGGGPPPWAPAHGYRHKHGGRYPDYPHRQSIVWHNPQAQAQYRITPLSSYTQLGRYCREYLTEAQLAPASREAKQLAAEMQWVMLLCQSNVHATNKRRVFKRQKALRT